MAIEAEKELERIERELDTKVPGGKPSATCQTERSANQGHLVALQKTATLTL